MRYLLGIDLFNEIRSVMKVNYQYHEFIFTASIPSTSIHVHVFA